jgi:hypothetical protein
LWEDLAKFGKDIYALIMYKRTAVWFSHLIIIFRDAISKTERLGSGSRSRICKQGIIA